MCTTNTASTSLAGAGGEHLDDFDATDDCKDGYNDNGDDNPRKSTTYYSLSSSAVNS